MSYKLTPIRRYTLARGEARARRADAYKSTVDFIEAWLNTSGSSATHLSKAEIIRRTDCRDRTIQIHSANIQAAHFHCCLQIANDMLSKFRAEIAEVNRREAEMIGEAAAAVIPPDIELAPWDFAPLPLNLVLDKYERYRWVFVGASTPALLVTMINSILPDFMAWLLAIPVTAFGALWGAAYFRTLKEREAVKEMAPILAEITRSVQRAALIRLRQASDANDDAVHVRWQEFLWRDEDMIIQTPSVQRN